MHVLAVPNRRLAQGHVDVASDLGDQHIAVDLAAEAISALLCCVEDVEVGQPSFHIR
eukprot:CAMPEP_0115058450 /NCGR_PEP_ID=MMETSP0227-20121206/6351_1 /TAXON_ID=89957 /ORGANISM="Polarella glacialis, Strain CCMP 1383" /LENGTH=56 /DNA_ID=CAMNT_0002443427 /DNA_START=548 /DNA_END=714 /DNA_ORIENTATION=+